MGRLPQEHEAGIMDFAVDFDGTLCVDKYPEIGEPRQGLIEFLKHLQERGDKLILWTCRCGTELSNAVLWCKDRGLVFDAVNDNLPEHVETFAGSNSRKVWADYYIDDRNLPIVV
jgi:hypothetical protein